MRYLLLIFLLVACHGGFPNSHNIRGNINNGFRGGANPYNSQSYYPGGYNGGMYNQYSPYGGNRYQNDFFGGGYYSQGGGGMNRGGGHQSYGGGSHHRGGGHHR